MYDEDNLTMAGSGANGTAYFIKDSPWVLKRMNRGKSSSIPNEVVICECIQRFQSDGKLNSVLKVVSATKEELMFERIYPLHPRKAGEFSVSFWLQSLISVCAAMFELHSFGIYHCDLKPNNIGVRCDFTTTPIDFGNSQILFEGDAFLHTIPAVSYCVPWALLDVRRKRVRLNRFQFAQIDMFSLFVTFAELLRVSTIGDDPCPAIIPLEKTKRITHDSTENEVLELTRDWESRVQQFVKWCDDESKDLEFLQMKNALKILKKLATFVQLKDDDAVSLIVSDISKCLKFNFVVPSLRERTVLQNYFGYHYSSIVEEIKRSEKKREREEEVNE